jgi:hypothetical protein
MARLSRRGWIGLGVALVVVVVGGTAAMVLSPQPAPAQATAAVTTFVNGTSDERRAALSPALASQVSTLPGSGAPSASAEVEVRGWRADGVFAAATATVRSPGGNVEMDVGFREVAGTWRLTFAQVRPQ